MSKSLINLKLVLMLILNFVLCGAVFAADGDLDPTFDGDGIVITDNSVTLDLIADLALQPDGKIVAVGPLGNSVTIVLRYNLDGSLDNTFGTGGKAVIQTPAFVNSVAIAPDGKIVISGWQVVVPNIEFPSNAFFVGRLNSNGNLDTTFNNTGTKLISMQSDAKGYSVIVQGDGKIIIGGLAGGFTQSDFALVRLNTDGTYDNSFDGDGIVFTQTHPLRTNMSFGELALQPDGKIVAVGGSRFSIGTNPVPVYTSLVTVRYNTDGTLDTTFDGDGIVFTRDLAEDTVGTSVSIATNGKIVVAGRGRAANQNFRGYLVRYNSDGSLDQSFATGGVHTSGFFPILEVEVQADNRIFVIYSLGLTRYNPDGSLDVTFAGTGSTFIPLPSGTTSALNTIALDRNRGKAYVAGSINPNQVQDSLVARFISNACFENCNVNLRKVADFDGDGRTDLSVFRNGTWYFNPSGFNNPSILHGLVNFGTSADKLAPADFDGDRKTDYSIFNQDLWYWYNSSNNTVSSGLTGYLPGDIPVPADYTGDGRADLAVFRGGFWHIYDHHNQQRFVFHFGFPTDKPVPADFDGDGKTDIAVYRDGVWYVQRSRDGFYAVQFGIAADKPVVGDYDGDNKADMAVYRDGVWYVLGSTQGVLIARWGVDTDIPVPGDYDGDGKTDFAIYRGGYWWIYRTQAGIGVFHFGLPSDKPIPAVFIP